MNTFPLFPEGSFDAETTFAMGQAYDQACAALDKKQSKVNQEMIAKRIVEATMTGERNPERLCEQALMSLVQSVSLPLVAETESTPLQPVL